MSIARLMQMGAAGAETSNPWDISGAQYNGSPVNWLTFSEVSTGVGSFFKPDGLKMYIVDTSADDVSEFNLSTAWDITTASYLQNFSVAAQDTTPQDVFFKPDGLKMYVVGSVGDAVYEYNLSTAWDVSTASFLQSFSVSAQDTTPSGIFFKPDGAKMYINGGIGDDVNEYDLSTAWDVSTASFLQSFSVSAQDTNPTSVFFKPDGLKMYVLGNAGDAVYEYDLSTAWDISTASFLQSFSVTNDGPSPQGVFFKPDGTKMYISDSNTRLLKSYDLSTAWDLSSASWIAPTTNYYGVPSVGPEGLSFKDDGTKMYVLDISGVDISEYDLSTAWEVSTASFLQSFSISAQELSPRDMFFKPDGTRMYVTGGAGDDVNEYNLSNAWDISSASFVRSFSVSAQETNPSGLFFKPDGTKMYVCGYTGDDVNEYDLSTAWNVSTASFVQVFDVSTEAASPFGVFFKDDGTKMYVLDSSGDDVSEYDLSTAWDISSASYLQNFSVQSLSGNNPISLFFKDDGTKLYIGSSSIDAIFSYDL